MVSRAKRRQGLNIKAEKAVSGAGIDADTELEQSPYAAVRDALRGTSPVQLPAPGDVPDG